MQTMDAIRPLLVGISDLHKLLQRQVAKHACPSMQCPKAKQDALLYQLYNKESIHASMLHKLIHRFMIHKFVSRKVWQKNTSPVLQRVHFVHSWPSGKVLRPVPQKMPKFQNQNQS